MKIRTFIQIVRWGKITASLKSKLININRTNFGQYFVIQIKSRELFKIAAGHFIC